jgi:hypothetical protein
MKDKKRTENKKEKIKKMLDFIKKLWYNDYRKLRKSNKQMK